MNNHSTTHSSAESSQLLDITTSSQTSSLSLSQSSLLTSTGTCQTANTTAPLGLNSTSSLERSVSSSSSSSSSVRTKQPRSEPTFPDSQRKKLRIMNPTSSVPLTPLPDTGTPHHHHLPQTPVQDDADSSAAEFHDTLDSLGSGLNGSVVGSSPSRRRSSPGQTAPLIIPGLDGARLGRIANDKNSLPLSPTLSPKTSANGMLLSPSADSLDTLISTNLMTSSQKGIHQLSKDSMITLSRQGSEQELFADAQESILQFYSTLPLNQKNKLLLSLLNVSPFPTLQSITSVILPRLKRDFLSLLPIEISLYILSFLDLRTLGRIASVCQSWNTLLEGPGADLAIWKKRCFDEGFLELQAHHSKRSFEKHRTITTEEQMKLDVAAADREEREELKQEQQYLMTRQQQHASQSNFLTQRKSSSSLQEYKARYRHHHRIRHNWFMGKYRQISFPGHGHNVVTCLQFDDDRIVSGSDDQTIHIYDTSTGSLLKRLSGHDGGVWALQYWNGALVSGSTDRTVRVWDMEAGECTHVFTGHTSTVRCLLIIQPPTPQEIAKSTVDSSMDLDGPEHPGVPLIVTGSRDATLRVWKLPNPRKDSHWFPPSHDRSPNPGNSRHHHHHDDSQQNPYFMHVLQGHTNSVRAIAGHATTLVSGSYDCTVRVWDLITGECRYVFRGHREKVYSVGYCHELERAVSGSMDTSVKVWCTKTGVCLFNLDGHTLLVGLLELSTQYLVSAAADSTLRIWSPMTGECLASLTGHSGAITCFHHDAKHNRIVSGSEGGVKVWELSSTGYSKASFNLEASQHTTASLTNQLNGIIPKNCPLGSQLTYKQGPKGPEPVYGRFIRDVISSVSGVWRVRMDEKRLVCAVQREDGGTWFEVLDFEAVDEDTDNVLSAAPLSAGVERYDEHRSGYSSSTPLQASFSSTSVNSTRSNDQSSGHGQTSQRRRHQGQSSSLRGMVIDTFGPAPIMQRSTRAVGQASVVGNHTRNDRAGNLNQDMNVDSSSAARSLRRSGRHSFSDPTTMARMMDISRTAISNRSFGESSSSTRSSALTAERGMEMSTRSIARNDGEMLESPIETHSAQEFRELTTTPTVTVPPPTIETRNTPTNTEL